MSGSGCLFRISEMKKQLIRVPGKGVCEPGSPGQRAGAPLGPAGRLGVRRGAEGCTAGTSVFLYWGFCFAQRGAVTWHGLQSFWGGRGEFAGSRVILNGGRGPAGAGASRRERALRGASRAGPGHRLVGQPPGTGLSSEMRMCSRLGWKVGPSCWLAGEGVGSRCRFPSSAPGSLGGRAGPAALGPGVAAAPRRGV